MSSQVVPVPPAHISRKPLRWLLVVGVGVAAILGLALALNHWVTSRTQFGIDFFIYWKAGQAVFHERSSPYTPGFTLSTQQGLYGRPAMPDEDIKGFAYPPYSLLAVLPALGDSYPWALALWIAINLVVLMTAVYIAFPGRPLWLKLTLPVFYPVAYGLVIGQFSVLLLGLALFVSTLLADGDNDPLLKGLISGGLLAWMTIKPQMTWPLIAFFLLIAWRDRRWWTIWGFVVAGAGFLAVSAWIVPGWFTPWLQQVLSGTDETLMAEPLALTYASWIAPDGVEGAAALMIGVLSLAALIWLVHRWRQGRMPTNSLMTWMVACALLIHPLLMSPDQSLMVLPLLGAGRIHDRSAWGRQYWPWAVALLLPWVLLMMPLWGLNSYAVTKAPPTLFIFWAMVTVFIGLRSNQGGAHERTA